MIQPIGGVTHETAPEDRRLPRQAEGRQSFVIDPGQLLELILKLSNVFALDEEVELSRDRAARFGLACAPRRIQRRFSSVSTAHKPFGRDFSTQSAMTPTKIGCRIQNVRSSPQKCVRNRTAPASSGR